MKRSAFFCALFLSGIFFVNALLVNAQLTFQDAKHFSEYLIKQKKYNEAIFVLKKSIQDSRQEKNQDSLKYLIGHSYLWSGQPDSAKKYFYFLLSSSDTALRGNSFTFFNHLLLHNLDSVKRPGEGTSRRNLEMYRIQTLAFLLLTRNYKAFKGKFDNEGKCRITELAAIEFNLLLAYYESIHIRKKNKYVAGILSSLLPGSGKLYTGKKHEALVAFVPVALNGAQSAEGFYHQQFRSPHFYLFGAIGLVFYSSNIYGSAKSATIINAERYEKIRVGLFTDIDAAIAKW